MGDLMANLSHLEEMANILSGNVSGWETSTLRRIGARIKKHGQLSIADAQAIDNIAIVNQDMEAITRELAKITGQNMAQVESMYGDLIAQQHLKNKTLYEFRGKAFIPFSENKELQAIVSAYAKTTNNTMLNLSKIGGSHLGFINKAGEFEPLKKMYTEALDKAVMQVASGSTDFYTAMRDTIVEMGGSGIRISYPESGITRRLDTAVRQSLLWGAKQASNEYNEMIGKELGCDGIEIDWHSNPRPSHEFMQGKQYVLGKARTIYGIYFESAEKALERLNDYGCLHYKTPIICGISQPRYSEKELEKMNAENKRTYQIDGKTVTGYEATQMQRQLETAIRNEKTKREMARSEGDKELIKKCTKRINAYKEKYTEISEITGIKEEPKRMSVPRKPKT